MTPETDTKEAHARLPSYGIRRILASVADDPALAGSDVTLIDYGRPDVRAYGSAIDAFQPDLIGISIYPTFVRDEHLEFLGSIGPSYLGVGLQSLDPDVLKAHDRPFDRKRFEAAIPQLAKLANVEIQIIFGLPGDSPEGFRRTLDYARSFGVGVRAYHCLVLPDALMTRGRPEWDMHFDPYNLNMISCLGWTPSSLQEMRSYLTSEAVASGGTAGNFWWFFPRS